MSQPRVETCPSCQGEGELLLIRTEIDGRMWELAQECERCGGRGLVPPGGEG